MSDDVFEVLVTEVNTLNNLLRKRAAHLLRDDSLAPAELRVLQILQAEGSKTVPEIGRLRLTSRQNIQITVNRLKKSGLVEIVPNPAHKRSDLVRLTSEGEAILERAQVSRKLFDSHLGTAISVAEAAAAVDFLRKLKQALAPGGKVCISRKQTAELVPGSARRNDAREGISPALSSEQEAAKIAASATPDEDEIPLSLL